MRIIGAADEFWRLRITRLDTTEGLDFEWHDDILYREPQMQPAEEVESWHVEAVDLADSENVARVASFLEREEAEEYLKRAQDDLGEMTKTQFEEAYLVETDSEEPESEPE